MKKPAWAGVFPAVTTQFRSDYSLDLDGTARHVEALIGSGVHGLIFLGSVGENTALEYHEKLTILRAMKEIRATDHRDSRLVARIPATGDLATWMTSVATIEDHALRAFSLLAVALRLVVCCRVFLWYGVHHLWYARIALTFASLAVVVNEHDATARQHLPAAPVDPPMVLVHLLRACLARVIPEVNDVAVWLIGSTSAPHSPASRQHHMSRWSNQALIRRVKVAQR